MPYIFEKDLSERQWDCYKEEKGEFVIVASGRVLMGQLLTVPLLKISLPFSLIRELIKAVESRK